MSELQISLLVIGAVVVAAVYAYGAWQQRQYRRRFGAAFKPQHGDALYQSTAASGALQDMPADYVEHNLTGAVIEPDDVCTTLNAASDYIAVLMLPVPMDASGLAPLWKQRFDFGKPVHVCGINAASGEWERVIAESQSLYSSFRLALQLADRNGAVSEARLSSFRDLARDIAKEIGADASLPDAVETARRAQALDDFCSEVDQMIGLNILPDGDGLLLGSDIAQVAAQHGLTLQADGTFHLFDMNGNTLCNLANLDSEPFQHHALKQLQVIGLTLQLDVPRVEHPAQWFDEMAHMAREIGKDLRANVVDDYRVDLNDAGIAMIREQVAAIEARMRAWPLAPGSAQARRLFS